MALEFKGSFKFLVVAYQKAQSSLDLQLPDPTRKLTVFAPTDAVLDPFWMNFSSSVFHRHFLPCKLTASDMLNLVLYREITVPPLYEGFTGHSTVVGHILLVNDVPLLYPDIPLLFMVFNRFLLSQLALYLMNFMEKILLLLLARRLHSSLLFLPFLQHKLLLQIQ